MNNAVRDESFQLCLRGDLPVTRVRLIPEPAQRLGESAAGASGRTAVAPRLVVIVEEIGEHATRARATP
jgi:hypothetical protein